MMSESIQPFHAHVELLRWFLSRGDEIIERIQELLNAQRKSIQYQQDASLLRRHVGDCFFTLTGITRDQSHLKDQLDEAHWARGFKPRRSPGLHNDLVDPAEMMVRAFHLWRQTHWPGHSGRVRYAQTLFNLYVVRRLALLSLRVWDAGSNGAGVRLSQLQVLLDEVWRIAPPDQAVLVRDVRWLIPVAQSPTTDELSGYFEVAEQIAETPSQEHRIEIQKAAVRMAGGHLRSQLRHVTLQKGVSLDENSLVLSTRRSNALDLALLVQGLVPLLEAYEHAVHSGEDEKRTELAAAICQGISPDPELFVNRLDLLGPYSMIEHLFITTDGEGNSVYTTMGGRHVHLLQEYKERISRLAKPLHDDCQRFRPVDGAYSPYGVLYGFSSNLIEHMAFKTLQRDAVTHFSLEDVFSDGGSDKLAWVTGWRKLPHITSEMAKQFEYPQQFAEDIFARIDNALHQRVSDAEADAGVQTGRLFTRPEADAEAHSKESFVPDLPLHYIRSSDRQIVAEHKAEAADETELLHGRLEGEFVLSYKTSGGWVAITKDILTEVLGAGRDVKIAGLPRSAIGVLRLTCPDLVILLGA
jgi:hypothetical protein